MAKEIRPQDTTRATAYELWMKAPNPMVTFFKTLDVTRLVKIGKTGLNNFEQRMYNLEKNGYSNVVGLKRAFAIEVDDYDEKEALLDTIFSKSQVPNTELFALDVNLVIQLLSSFDGKQVYPPAESKEVTFTQATENREIALIPNGTYKMSRKLKNVGITATAKLEIIDGQIILKAGSIISPQE